MVSERRGRTTGIWEQALMVVPPNSNLQRTHGPTLCEFIYFHSWEEETCGILLSKLQRSHSCGISTRLHRGSYFHKNRAMTAIKSAFSIVCTEVQVPGHSPSLPKGATPDPYWRGPEFTTPDVFTARHNPDQSNYATKTWFPQVQAGVVAPCKLLCLALTWQPWEGS